MSFLVFTNVDPMVISVIVHECFKTARDVYYRFKTAIVRIFD